MTDESEQLPVPPPKGARRKRAQSRKGEVVEPTKPAAREGESTGIPEGRKPGKRTPNVKVMESETVDASEDGDITERVEEFVRDPLVDAMRSPRDVNELVEITGENNDRLMYGEWESGATIEEVAARWKIKPAVAELRINAAHAKMVEEFEGDDLKRLRATQDRDLRRIRGVALREFEKSKGERKRVTIKNGIVADKLTDVKEVVTNDAQPGDPRFLSVALVASQQLDRLWGVEAPRRVKHEGNVGLQVSSLGDMDDETLLAMAEAHKHMQRLKARVTQSQAQAIEAKVIDSSAVKVGG